MYLLVQLVQMSMFNLEHDWWKNKDEIKCINIKSLQNNLATRHSNLSC